jgi:hypothetical protein
MPSVTGKVSRIFPAGSRTSIRLEAPPPLPLSGYFVLRQTHTNYSALYSLALAAAVNRYDLTINTADPIDPTLPADVRYMVVDWAS